MRALLLLLLVVVLLLVGPASPPPAAAAAAWCPAAAATCSAATPPSPPLSHQRIPARRDAPPPRAHHDACNYGQRPWYSLRNVCAAPPQLGKGLHALSAASAPRALRLPHPLRPHRHRHLAAKQAAALQGHGLGAEACHGCCCWLSLCPLAPLPTSAWPLLGGCARQKAERGVAEPVARSWAKIMRDSRPRMAGFPERAWTRLIQSRLEHVSLGWVAGPLHAPPAPGEEWMPKKHHTALLDERCCSRPHPHGPPDSIRPGGRIPGPPGGSKEEVQEEHQQLRVALSLVARSRANHDGSRPPAALCMKRSKCILRALSFA